MLFGKVLGWDSLLKTVHNAGGIIDILGRGVDPTHMFSLAQIRPKIR